MEKRLQLWSPVWGWLATKEGESVDLKGQDLVLYETAIQEALEQEKLYYRKKSVLRSILFDAVICRIRQIKISHFQPCYNGNNFFLLLL